MRTILVALVLALAVAAGAVAASAAPSRAAKLTPAESKWISPVVKIWNAMNSGLLVIQKQTTADQALIQGTKANKTLSDTLVGFALCSQLMKKVKEPPTARLQPFDGSMRSACTHLGAGAQGVANGITSISKKRNAQLATLQIKGAFKEFAKGSSSLSAAARQLAAVSGNASG